MPVEILETPSQRLPAPVESATYFVIAEALTNVARYADAEAATVRVSRDNGAIEVEVRDDGVGGADPANGHRPARPRGPGRRARGPAPRHQPRRRRHHRGREDPLRVVVADDSTLLREGVVRLLEEAGLEVVGQAADGEDLLRKVRAHKPDVAVVDVRMPPTHTDEGLRAAREIRDELPDVGVLVLSQYVEVAYARELLAESAEGLGYLLKDRVGDVDSLRRRRSPGRQRRLRPRPRGRLEHARPGARATTRSRT